MAFAANFHLPTKIQFPTTITATTQQHHHLRQQQQQRKTLKTLINVGKLDEALHLIHQHHHQHPLPISSYAAFLHSCITQRSVSHGQSLYLHLLLHHPSTVLHQPTILSRFITLFSTSSDDAHLDEARRVFRHALEATPGRSLDESVWAAMVMGHSRNGYHKEALVLYAEMLAHSVEPRDFTFSTVVKASRVVKDSRIGKAIHTQIIKFSEEEPDQVVYNALLRLYNEMGRFDHVLNVFETMPRRNVASWNALIIGLAKKGRVFEAFKAFRRMVREGSGFNWDSFAAILLACGRVSSLYLGKVVHARVLKSDRIPDTSVLNSLMDMYAKCGDMGYCTRVFDGMEERDLTSWNTVLNGYVIGGCMEDAMGLFEEMIECGVRPDGATFVALLSGCSHGGLVNEGQALFDRMIVEFRVEPSLEHYACLVDIYGRDGRIEEALQMVRLMPVEPNGRIWSSLLNSCRLHGNLDLVEEIAEELFEVEPNNPGNYAMLSDIYASAGMWEGVNKVQEMMAKRGIKKDAEFSWIQIKNRIHTFAPGGVSEFCNSDDYKKLQEELSIAMEANGYRTDTKTVLRDAERLCGHSERVATTFGLIHIGPGRPIRIAKNLRACTDCHSWIQSASKVTGRNIFLRDAARLHHFHGGSCSCKDYW